MDDGRRGPLRVGIDGASLAMRRGTGLATYARTLSHCLADLGYQVDVLYGLSVSRAMPAALREVVFFDSLDQEKLRPAPKFPSARWRRELLRAAFPHTAVEIPITGRVIGRGFAGRLPRCDRIFSISDLFPMAMRHFNRYRRFLPVRIADGPDIMHWTAPLPIRLLGACNIYTVRDVIRPHLQDAAPDNQRQHLRLLAGCLKYGARICTVSEASRRDMLSFFPHAAPRIINTSQSIVMPPAPAGGETIPALFGLDRQRYFLCFGVTGPGKNLPRIIDAYLASGVKTPLVIVGARHLATPVHRIRQLDYLPAELLAGLIRSARAVLFPSLQPTFGLPVLEAMALGTPVLTSREASLPEIAGDAAVFADAHDTGDIARGIRQLDDDDRLREELIARGRRQAAQFDMAQYRERIRALYRL